MVARTNPRYAPLALFAARAGHPAAPLSFRGFRAWPSTSNTSRCLAVRRPRVCPPPALVAGERPFDPDELPIEALQTDEEREFSSTLPPRAYAPGGVRLPRESGSADGCRWLAATRIFSLRRIARILGGN